MTLDARLNQLKPPEAADPALEVNLDGFTADVPAAPAADPVQVAGIGSGLKNVVKGVTKQAPAAPKPPKVETTVTPQPQAVEKLIDPPAAAAASAKAEARVAAGDPATGKPPDELFNWMRTGLPDDANTFIDEVAKVAGVKRPQAITHKEVLDDLQAMGYTSKDVDWILNYGDNTKEMRRVAMAREALVSTAKMTQELAKQLTVNPSPELAVKYHQATVLLGQLSRGVKNISTDYARALGVMRANPTGDVAALEGFLNQVGGIDDVVAHAGKLAKLDLTNAANVKRLADMAEKSTFSKVKDIWVTTWINGLLSSPITHAKNIIGNELFAAIQVPERFTASLIGKARMADDAIEMEESVALLRGMVAGQVQAFRAFGKAFVENAAVTTSGTKLSDAGATVADFGDYLGWGGMAGRAANLYGKAVTLPGRALLAEDEYFKVQGYYMELYAQASRAGSAARREALAAGKSQADADLIGKARADEILTNPPEDVNAVAWDASRYLTFSEPLEHGSVGRHFQDLASSNVVARMFLPFVRTPVNIAAATLERTPFAPFTKSFQEAWAAGGITRDLALARVAVGTTLLTSAGYLGTIGRITGSGPGDKGQREALERSGWQPYSFVFYKGEVNASTRKLLNEYGRITEMGDKVFWQFQGLEPIGGILSMGADYAEYARWNDNVGEVEQVGYGVAFGLARYTTELPYLQGMAEVMQTLMGYGTGQVSPDGVKRMVTALTKQGTSFLVGGSPAGAFSSAQALVERQIDPAASDTRVPLSVGPALKGVHEALNHYRSRVPGLSSQLPPKTNRWAEPIQYGEGALYEVVSPIRVKEGSQKEVDRVWLQYDLPRGQPARAISWAERPDMAGIKVELTAEQFNELKRVYAWDMRDGNGMNVQQAIVEATKDRAFPQMSFKDQQAYLMKLDSAFMSAARTKLVNDSKFSRQLQAEFERKKLAADAYGIYSEELR